MSKLIVSMCTLSHGGAERVLSILSESLADRFDEVIYVMWKDAPIFYPVDKRVVQRIIPKEIHSNNEFSRMLWFRKFVKKESPDLVLSFLEPYNIRVLISTIGIGIKTMVAERNDPRSVNKYLVVNQFEKIVYRMADRIIVQTDTIKQFFGGGLQKRTCVIPNPVIITEKMVGMALNTHKKKRVVSVARLFPQKKHDVLIKAFARFHSSHPDYTLTIYGEGPQKNDLLHLISVLGVSESVSLAGVVKSVHQEILDAEMFCLVSQREGMSNAMIEAMCLGLPCICTKVSGAKDLIDSGENGLLVEIDDETDLAAQMCRIADNPTFAESLGRRAAQIFNMLRSDKVVRQWIDCIEKTMSI